MFQMDGGFAKMMNTAVVQEKVIQANHKRKSKKKKTFFFGQINRGRDR